jgi:hypothetical protein
VAPVSSIGTFDVFEGGDDSQKAMRCGTWFALMVYAVGTKAIMASGIFLNVADIRRIFGKDFVVKYRCSRESSC